MIFFSKMLIPTPLFFNYAFKNRVNYQIRNVNSTTKKVKPKKRITWGIPVGLGVIGYYGIYHYFKDDENRTHAKVEGPFHIRLYASLPLRYLSQCWGYVNDLTVPKRLRAPLYNLYSNMWGCNLEEMEETELENFENLGQFFYRSIRKECRPIATTKEAKLVSPSDGTILHFGKVYDDEIEQIKGVTYSLNALLGPRPGSGVDPQLSPTYLPSKNKELYFTTIYLAPGDYHRFHSPTEWSIDIYRHFAGEMFSVSPKVVSQLKHLFSLNERVSMIGSWQYGLFTMIPVAATNVGKIVLNFAPDLMTNVPKKLLDRPLGSHIEQKVLQGGNKVSFKRGEEMGGFKLGSTVVMVFEAPVGFEFFVKEGQKIKLGQALGK
jgi:phosphatidylserine decarboxylase